MADRDLDLLSKKNWEFNFDGLTNWQYYHIANGCTISMT